MSAGKEFLFNEINRLRVQIRQVDAGDKVNGKKILMGVDDITAQFNKAKAPNGPKDLELDATEIEKLKSYIDDIWTIAEGKDIEVWPRPDIVTKVG